MRRHAMNRVQLSNADENVGFDPNGDTYMYATVTVTIPM